MSTATLYSVHFTKKIALIRGSRAQCEQRFVYLSPDQLCTIHARLRQLLDHEFVMPDAKVADIKDDEITTFEELDAALSKLCFNLPLNATADDIGNAQSKSADAAAASAGQRAEKELRERLRREREKQKKF